MKMHSFSIDNITNGQSEYKPPTQQQYLYQEPYRPSYQEPYIRAQPPYSRTPSPVDSGIDTSSISPAVSPTPTVSHTLSNVKVDQILDKLSATSEMLVKPGSSMGKPSHSFLALVSMAILSSPDRKLLLGDIYQYIMDNFPYYNSEQKAWRNSIRHNLSLNECFIKDGRSESGKGNYWTIHPAVEADFAKGDFRRRQARRKSRKNVKTVSDATPAPKHGGYVTMTPSNVGYHPYTSANYYPHHQTPAPAHQATTTSGAQHKSTEFTPNSVTYTPNGDSSELYQYYYAQPATNTTTVASTSQTSLTSSDYGSPLMMTSFIPATSQPNAYTYSGTSDTALPTDN